jgi:hypothetical protein
MKRHRHLPPDRTETETPPSFQRQECLQRMSFSTRTLQEKEEQTGRIAAEERRVIDAAAHAQIHAAASIPDATPRRIQNKM